MASLIIKEADVYIAADSDVIAIVKHEGEGVVTYDKKSYLAKIVLDENKDYPDSIADILVLLHDLCIGDKLYVWFKYDRENKLFKVYENKLGEVGSIVFDRNRYILTFYSDSLPLNIINSISSYIRNNLGYECYIGFDLIEENVDQKLPDSNETSKELEDSENPEGKLNIELINEENK